MNNAPGSEQLERQDRSRQEEQRHDDGSVGSDKRQRAHLRTRTRTRTRAGLVRLLQHLKPEKQGIEPLSLTLPRPPQNSSDILQLFYLWSSANLNILSFSTGALAPTLGLDMRSSLICIPLWVALFSLVPAYVATFGPATGLRQIVFCRYSWGYYATGVIIVLSCATQLGYSILNTILGGQTLRAASSSLSLSLNAGIILSVLLSLLISFSGLHILTLFELYAWIVVLPVLIALPAVAGTGAAGLHLPVEVPLTTQERARAVLAMGAVLAGYVITWSTMSCDVTRHLRPSTPRRLLFLSVYLGFLLSTALTMVLGASFAHASQDIPIWSEALSISSGQLVRVALKDGAGARFANVILALSTVGNVALTFYSFGLSFMSLPRVSLGRTMGSKVESKRDERMEREEARDHAGKDQSHQASSTSEADASLAKRATRLMKRLQHQLPRFIYPVLATAIVLPLSIVGANQFSQTLTNFLSIIGYWAAPFCATLLMEHWIFKMPDARRRARGRLVEHVGERALGQESKPSWQVPAGQDQSESAAADQNESGSANHNHDAQMREAEVEADSLDAPLALAYPQSIYANPNKLPTGLAALATSVLSVAIMVPCMDQVWFAGPLARRSGDLAFEVGFALSIVLYPPIRLVDRHCFGR
ncbi:60s ribosomal protein L34 [Ceraceosorus bombacis]|uniref:60s ribosomal protein L34 n=1 Tax=Ceraceosorus bombacis TaxID=401625 RepID=A0A0P1BK75_9BASI|nr:60s ribosomal protein L34 [Ceraceosorus bombacis]